MQPGNLMLWAALIVTAVAAVFYISLANNRERSARAGRAYRLSAFIIVVTSVLFMLLIIRDRFDVEYIALNSSKSLPIYYKISVFWAAQQGSFLFWVLCVALMGLVVMHRAREYEPVFMTFWSIIQAVFIVLLLVDSPFKPLSDELRMRLGAGMGSIPDGMGLKGVLQNPWMVVHPPVTFIGYTAMFIPAGFAVAALIKGEFERWSRIALSWAVFGWTTLGAGLILGAYWAYEVLGWGGYWAWDPVENSSLVPWITGTALVHGLIAERYRGSFRRANLILAIITLLFVFYATFLTRSSVLSEASVHSFGDTGTGGLLLYFLLSMLAACTGLIIWRWKSVKSESASTSVESRDFAFYLAVIFTAAAAALVILGTSAPIIGRIFSKSIVMDRSFYDKAVSPEALFILTLMAIVPLLSWQKDAPRRPILRLSLAAAALVFAAALTAMLFGKSVIYIWILAAAVGAVALIGLIVNAYALIRASKRGMRAVGGFAAHVGMAIMFLGIVLSANGKDSDTLLFKGPGSTAEALGFNITYEGRQKVDDLKTGLKFRFDDQGRKFTAMPTIPSTSKHTNDTPPTPHIINTLTGDLYISPNYVYEPAQVWLTKDEPIDIVHLGLKFIDFDVPKGQNEQKLKIGAKIEVTAGGKTHELTPVMIVESSPPPPDSVVKLPGMDATLVVDRIIVEEKAVEVTIFPADGQLEHIRLIRGKETPISRGRKLVFEEWVVSSGESGHGQGMRVNIRIKVLSPDGSDVIQPVFSPENVPERTITSKPVTVPGESMSLELINLNIDHQQVFITVSPTVDTVAISISTKPFISLIWLGAIIALFGGGVAMWRRAKESAAMEESKEKPSKLKKVRL